MKKSELKEIIREELLKLEGVYDAYPILPIGSTNLETGECKYFNIFDVWKNSTAEFWKFGSNIRMICTAGKSWAKKGEKREFMHDQTHKKMGVWTFLEDVPVKKLKNFHKYGKKLFGYTYK